MLALCRFIFFALLLGLGLGVVASAQQELTERGKQLVRHDDVGDYGAHVNTIGGDMLSVGWCFLADKPGSFYQWSRVS